jgi:isopentenyl phosphate kinase
LISKIDVDSNGKYSIPKTSNLTHDVTGGMLGKLECGKDIAMNGIPVYLTRAGSDSMYQICHGA